MALAYTMSIVDSCIGIWGCSEGQDEQFGTPIGLLRPPGRYGFSGAHICARCGSELVGCQCLETTVVPAKTALPFTASPQYRHPSSSPKKILIFNGKAKFLFCHYVAACVWETYQIVIQPVWLQQRDLFWACPPFTPACQIPPLFRQSRDRRYWRGDDCTPKVPPYLGPPPVAHQLKIDEGSRKVCSPLYHNIWDQLDSIS